MAAREQRTLLDFIAPANGGLRSSIAVPAVEAQNFELKPALINMIQNSLQFGGTASEDPHTHLRKFLRLTDTIKINGVSEDVIRLKLFPFSVTERVNDWLNSLPEASITSWQQLQRHFLTQYFPPSVASRLMAEIAGFSQYEHESLYEAWERFQDLLRRCPHHGYQVPQLVQIFYYSLSITNRSMVDAACGGGILHKPPADTWRVMGEIASNSHQWRSADRHVKKREPQPSGIYQVDQNALLASQMETLNKKLEAFMLAQSQPAPPPPPAPPVPATCNLCGSMSHGAEGCLVGAHFAQQPEEANYMGNTYNPSWKNHPNLSWGGNQNNQHMGPNQNAYRPPHAQNQGGYRPEKKEPSFHETVMQKFQATETRFQNIESRFQNMENQLGQIINLLGQRPPGALPSQPEVNPKEQAKAITLRSGKEVELPIRKEEEVVVTENHQVPTEGSTLSREKGKEKAAEKVLIEPYQVKVPFL